MNHFGIEAMDTIDTIHSGAELRSIRSSRMAAQAGRARRLLMRSVDGIATWARKRKSRRVLRGLTDSELRDIGLTRKEAMNEVGKSRFWD